VDKLDRICNQYGSGTQTYCLVWTLEVPVVNDSSSVYDIIIMIKCFANCSVPISVSVLELLGLHTPLYCESFHGHSLFFNTLYKDFCTNCLLYRPKGNPFVLTIASKQQLFNDIQYHLKFTFCCIQVFVFKCLLVNCTRSVRAMVTIIKRAKNESKWIPTYIN
jgi:hypothetical protein